MLSPELLFYSMLDEKQKRLYAGLKALMLGYHGVSQVAAELAIHAHTVRLGQKELSSSTLLAPAKVRKAGGGRKKKIESEPKISAFFDDLVKDNTAGSPMDGRIRWTDISLSGFVKLYDQLGIKLTRFIIKQLLKQQGYVKRKMSKNGIIKEVAHRDEQFEYIAAKKKEFIAKNLPVLSIDTKKKEFIGKLYRQGACYCTEAEVVYDHDFPSLADGVLIPHGIFDVVQNRGYMTIGTSKDTSEFLVDNIKHHWLNNIQQNYENADQMLLLMDGGGSNSCLHYIVKEDLQKLVNELQISITIAHYPAYCSKYNPIEHRLFPHIQRNWQGVVFKSKELVKQVIEKTTTTKGLKVVAWINEKVYKTGRKYAENFKENMTICFNQQIPKWNYTIKPL